MYIHHLERRQQPPTTGGSAGSPGDSTNGGLPTYLWALVVIFIALAITCCMCARRTRLSQNLYRQAILNSRRPTGSDRNPYGPPWATFSRTGADPSGLQPPPRARRRGSQASVTSLPVYMENPGAQEVVLLQRAIPKDGDSREHPTTQPTTGAAESNPHMNGVIAPSQPISVASAPTAPPAPATTNSTPQLSAVPFLPGSHSPTAAPSDTRPTPRS